MTAAHHISLSVPSRLEHLDLLQATAEEFARVAGLDDDARIDLALAVREAAVNAIKHGNGMDERRPLQVEFRSADGAVSVAVRDQGNGFDPEQCPDPCAPENLLKTSGRGLLLIRSLVDEVRFHVRPRGMELVLVKHRVRPSAAAS